jgi:hypothetical protein
MTGQRPCSCGGSNKNRAHCYGRGFIEAGHTSTGAPAVFVGVLLLGAAANGYSSKRSRFLDLHFGAIILAVGIVSLGVGLLRSPQPSQAPLSANPLFKVRTSTGGQ